MSDRREEPKPAEVRARKTYQRPKVKKVELRPEEAVLGACKTAATCLLVSTQGS